MKKDSEKKQKKKLKKWVKALIIIGSIILSLGVILLGAIGYFKLSVLSYYKASEKAFKLPEIHSGVVPQGFHYDQDNDLFLLSGYMKDGSLSPVYAVDKNTGKATKKVFFETETGALYTGHAGGITVWKDYFYLADGKGVLVYSYTSILKAAWGDKIECLGRFSTKVSNDDYINVSCLTVYNDRLIIGEFYRADSYPTPNSHKITTTAGDYNQAIGLQYLLSDTFNLGINPTPELAYSLPDHVQGMTFYQDKLYISTSWGLSFSHIYEYDQTAFSFLADAEFLGYTLPVYAVDSSSLLHDYKIAPMSEEIAFADGYLYVLSESASNKYLFGNFIGGTWCYKTDLNKMKNA